MFVGSDLFPLNMRGGVEHSHDNSSSYEAYIIFVYYCFCREAEEEMASNYYINKLKENTLFRWSEVNRIK